jgi:agmatine/peptidylarginine deiminase
MNYFVTLHQIFAMGNEIHTKKWRFPAEWEPQEGVQLTWPHKDTDWAPMLNEIIGVYREMAREIAKRERLIIVAPENVARDCLRIICDTNDTWARDHGFISLIDDEGHRLLLDFCFNGWGEKFEATLDNAINCRLYDSGEISGEYRGCLDFVLEGGSIESDGRGTILTTSQCLLAPHRNQPLTKEEIELRLKKELWAERILWIDHGQLTGDDTDGHIDTLVRICPDDTLLYMGCDDPHDEQYEELRLMEEQLRTFRTLDGRPYRLQKLPMPHPIYDGDDRLPATYANFLIINGAVLCPTYGQPDLDSEALCIIGEAFPDREIISIDSRPIIRQHGSIHCCAMQFPKEIERLRN